MALYHPAWWLTVLTAKPKRGWLAYLRSEPCAAKQWLPVAYSPVGEPAVGLPEGHDWVTLGLSSGWPMPILPERRDQACDDSRHRACSVGAIIR